MRDTVKQPRHWFRPESEKYMTVEMEKPFVWPEDPESWEPWGKKEKSEQMKKSMHDEGVQTPLSQINDARKLRLQAVELLNKRTAQRAKLWEKRRTPQILNHELLPMKNFKSVLNASKSKSKPKPKPVEDTKTAKKTSKGS